MHFDGGGQAWNRIVAGVAYVGLFTASLVSALLRTPAEEEADPRSVQKTEGPG